MRIHGRVDSSTANGPGNRAVIWVQGCQGMSCASACWNKDSHDPAGGADMPVEEIIEWLEDLGADASGFAPSSRRDTDIEGLTISGGEPLQQSQSILMLVRAVRSRFPSLSIGMFSGYSELELRRGQFPVARQGPQVANTIYRQYIWTAISKRLDFAVLGRYNAALPCSEPLTTSSNQKVHLLSTRYSLSDFRPQIVEITINELGLTQLTGFPTKGTI